MLKKIPFKFLISPNLLFVVLVLFGFSKTANAATALPQVIYGGATRESVSQAVVGDFNGDGKSDFAVGVYTDNGNTGAIRIYTNPLKSSSSPTIVLTGENSADFAGESIAAGDFNGDGIDDLLVSAKGNDAAAVDAGTIYLVLGSSSLASGSLSAHLKMTGELEDDDVGFGSTALSNAGDVNKDGIDDMLIGASELRIDRSGPPSEMKSTGAAYLVLGSASPASMSLADATAKYTTGEDGVHQVGLSVAGAGDVNSDGYADMVIGAGGFTNGVVYLVLGSAAPSTLNLFDDAIEFQAAGCAGSAVAGVGDVNGDDFDDILVGAPYYDYDGSRGGAAYLVLGGSLLESRLLSSRTDPVFIGESISTAGNSVAKAGDMNADGFDDFLIGAYQNSESTTTFTSEGAAYLVYGHSGFAPSSKRLSASVGIRKFQGKAADDHAGASVGPGDASATPPYFMIGAPQNDDKGADAGAIWQQVKIPGATGGYKLKLQ